MSAKALMLTDSQARDAYPESEGFLRQALENTWGKKFFEGSITDRVRNFEDACMILNINAELPEFTVGTPKQVADAQLDVIIQVLNEGWKPNWEDSSEAKWSPYFYFNSPGFRFGDSSYDYAGSRVGSRRVLKTAELSNYVGKQFVDLYKDSLT